MRRNTDKPEVPWSAKVHPDAKATFLALLPMRGAQIWMIETALEKFLSICDHDPRMVERAKKQIHEHMYEDTTPGNKKNFDVKIRRELYNRFDNHFPMMGATSWFIRTVIERVNTQLNNIVLEEQIEAAVRTIFQDQDGTE